MMHCVTGCHTLSKAIDDAVPKISDGTTSPNTFATSFIGAKSEEKTINCTKTTLKTFTDYSQIVNAATKISNSRFR